RLADDSPLAAMPKHEAIRELEARLGPRAGATWTLESGGAQDDGSALVAVEFPSGVDDVLTFELAPGPEPRLRSVRCLADLGGAADPLLAADRGNPARAVAVALAMSLLAAAVIGGGGRRAGATGMVALLLVLGCRGRGSDGSAEPSGPALLGLGGLAELRAALAEGRPVSESASGGS